MKDVFIALAEEHPWLIDVGQWLYVAKQVWHSVEGFVVVLGLWWVHQRLKRERLKMATLVGNLGGQIQDLDDNLDEKIDTVKQLAKAAREAAETVQAGATSSAASVGSLEYWEQLRAAWQEMRDRIQMMIERIGGKRTRAKYSKINRYGYHDIIVSLFADEEIDRNTEDALLQMDKLFMGLKPRPSQVTANHVAQFQALAGRVNGALPPLPKSAAEEPRLQPPALQAAE